jgi:hypothetical protein
MSHRTGNRRRYCVLAFGSILEWKRLLYAFQ